MVRRIERTKALWLGGSLSYPKTWDNGWEKTWEYLLHNNNDSSINKKNDAQVGKNE